MLQDYIILQVVTAAACLVAFSVATLITLWDNLDQEWCDDERECLRTIGYLCGGVMVMTLTLGIGIVVIAVWWFYYKYRYTKLNEDIYGLVRDNSLAPYTALSRQELILLETGKFSEKREAFKKLKQYVESRSSAK